MQKTAPKNTKYSIKWDHFENRPSCKGYSPCKILTLSQKLKFQKTCQKPFYKSFTVVLCKKPLQKTPNIRKIRPFWKSAIMQRLYSFKYLQNRHLGWKIKIPKKTFSSFRKSRLILLIYIYKIRLRIFCSMWYVEVFIGSVCTLSFPEPALPLSSERETDALE